MLFPRVTKGVLKIIPDDDLNDVLFQCIKHPEGLSEEQLLAQLSPGQRMVYLTFLIEGEVGNGGFNQYFFNKNGEFEEETIAAYELIGATDYADCTRQAFEQFRQVKQIIEEADKRSTQAKTFEEGWNAFVDTSEETGFEHFDNMFEVHGGSRWNKLVKLRAKYIRAHVQEFVEPGEEPWEKHYKKFKSKEVVAAYNKVIWNVPSSGNAMEQSLLVKAVVNPMIQAHIADGELAAAEFGFRRLLQAMPDLMFAHEPERTDVLEGWANLLQLMGNEPLAVWVRSQLQMERISLKDRLKAKGLL